MKKEFKAISQIIKNNKRVLDVVCGDGTLMEYLKHNHLNAVRGLEPQKNLLQKCIASSYVSLFLTKPGAKMAIA